MATKKTAEKEEKEDEKPVATEESKALARAERAKALEKLNSYGEDAGEGLKDLTKADVSYPFMNLMQPLSPLVTDEKAEYGDWANSATGQVWKMSQGFLFVPAIRSRFFVKWAPRGEGGGKGYRGQLEPTDPIVVEVQKTQKLGEYSIEMDGEKLKLRDTRYVFGSLMTDDGEDFLGFGVVAFWSTKIKVFRDWMTKISQFAAKVPMYAHSVRFTSIKTKNDKGPFALPVINPAVGSILDSLIPVDHPCYLASKNLHKTMKSAALMEKVDFSQQADGADPTADEDIPF